MRKEPAKKEEEDEWGESLPKAGNRLMGRASNVSKKKDEEDDFDDILSGMEKSRGIDQPKSPPKRPMTSKAQTKNITADDLLEESDKKVEQRRTSAMVPRENNLN